MPPGRTSVVVSALLATSLVAGCGGDGDKKTAAGTSSTPTETAPAPAPGPAEKIVRQRDVQNIPLGTPEDKILKAFGEPVGRPSNSGQSCLVYATDAGPDTWLRFCFKDGKLVNQATVIGRKNALTLDPPLPKGPGKVRQPNLTPPPKKK